MRSRISGARASPRHLVNCRPDMAVLNWGERLDIIDAWAQVLDGVYAHLPLKRASVRLRSNSSDWSIFANKCPASPIFSFIANSPASSIVCATRTRSTPARTVLREPSPRCPFSSKRGALLMIPTTSSRKSATADSSTILTSQPGVTLTFWNGVPFDRAVDMHADSETGGRPDARQARALDSLTFRSLEYGPPPDEHWVDISYIDLKKKKRETRMPWRVVCPNRAPSASSQGGSARMRRGIDPAAEAVRRAKKLMFNAALWAEERAGGSNPTASRSLTEKYEDFLTARKVDTSNGRFGYLRIWSFDVNDDQQFIEAAIKLLAGLPNRGAHYRFARQPGRSHLGCRTYVAILHSEPHQPTKFGLRATPLTNAMAICALQSGRAGPLGRFHRQRTVQRRALLHSSAHYHC